MTPRRIAVEILNKARQDKVIVDLVIEQHFQQKRLTNQHRAFIYEIVLGTMRWRKKFEWILSRFFSGKYAKTPLTIKNILESSLYQFYFLSKTPEFATVNEAVSIAKKMKGQFWAGRVNAVLRSVLRQRNDIVFPDLESEPVKAISVRYSHPAWLIERWLPRFGIEQTQRMCELNNQKPHIALKVNRLKITPEKLLTKLAQQKISVQPSPVAADFLRAGQLPPLRQFKPFQEGLFTIQDESAGLVGRLLAPKSNDTILDLCAAPGGKTMHLAELSADKGCIVAVDRYPKRLQLVQQNARRLGVSSVHGCVGDARQFATSPVDKILLDVPCSGLGVLAKRADLRWLRTPDDILTLQTLQLQILRNAATLITKKGVIVYSTCTIAPEENEDVIEIFLREFPEFQLDDPVQYVPDKFVSEQRFVRTLPFKHGIDGSFAARLVRI